MSIHPKLIVLATLAMLLPISAIVIFVVMYYRKQQSQRQRVKLLGEHHRKQLLEASIHTQEQVRRQLGGDLHDDVGAHLSTVRLSLGMLERTLDNTELQKEYLHNTQNLVNDLVTKVRALSKELVPSTLDNFGLSMALQDFTSLVSSHTGINVVLQQISPIGRYSQQVELALYRTVQELVNNALKHAQATQIDVFFSEIEGKLHVEVADNGVGFDPTVFNEPNRGIGLRNIESRLSVINGTINFDIAKGRGSRFQISVPI